MELIHPLTGLKRVWPPSDALTARDSMPLQAVAPSPRVFQPLTKARLSDHAIGMLWTPVTPTIARGILQNALGGDLQSQYDLFCTMEDSWDRLAKCLNEVRNAVKRLSWTVTPYSTGDDQVSPEAQAKAELVEMALKNWEPEVGSLEYGFEDWLWNGLDAMGKGIAVQEIHWQLRDGYMVPRAAHYLTPRHYGWAQDGSRIGLISGRSWQPFPQEQFTAGVWHIRSGAPGATALMRPLVPYWLGMTYGWRWLMQTAQIFGVPFRWATYDANQPGLLNTISEMLENLGSAGWAAFPAGTTLEFKEAVTSARDNPQMLIIELAKKACDLLILGQELSSESEAAGLGSGNAMLQGKVRQDVLHNAAHWSGDQINYQLTPAVLRLNFGESSEAPVVAPDLSIDPDPKLLAERDQILLNSAEVEMPKKWFHERHGIPMPEEGEEMIKGKGPAMGLQGFGDLPAEPADNPEITAKQFAEAVLMAKDQAVADKLVENVLEDLTGVEAKWLGGVKPFFVQLLEMARDEKLSDSQFLQALERAQKEMPELFAKLNREALEAAFYNALSPATVNGAVQGWMKRRRRK